MISKNLLKIIACSIISIIFQLEGSTQQNGLKPIDFSFQPQISETILTSSWCCSGSDKLLAIGGKSPNLAYAFNYNATTNQLNPISFSSACTIGYQVLSSAWCCNGSNIFLALAGGDLTGLAPLAPTLQVFRYNSLTSQLDNVIFAAPIRITQVIYSCCWCCDGTDMLLAVSGSYGADPLGKSVQVFKYNLGANQFDEIVIDPAFFSGSSVSFACSWCCDDTDKILAAAVNFTSGGTLLAFKYNQATGQLDNVPLSTPSLFKTVISGCAWCCEGADKFLATVGSAVSIGKGPALQIFKYNADSGQLDDVEHAIGETAPGIQPTFCNWCCTGSQKLLAFNAVSHTSNNLCVVRYNSALQQFEEVDLSELPENFVPLCCSWCCNTNQAILTIGCILTTPPELMFTYNDETNKMDVLNFCSNQLLVNSSVQTNSWCCNDINKFLALGGDGTQHVQVFELLPICQTFQSNVLAGAIQCDGQRQITLIASGGSCDYYYSLTGSAGPFYPFVSPLTLTLNAGNYSIVIKDDTGPYPCMAEPVTIDVPQELKINNILYQQNNCLQKTPISVQASGGLAPLHYFADGAEQSGPQFIVKPGEHIIAVQDSREPYPCEVSQTILTGQCPLFLLNTHRFGAPIQTVSWLCSTDECPYNLIAVGGYHAMTSTCLPLSVRVYSFDPVTTRLNELSIDNPLPTEFVYSVQWCCINGVAYLAVAGCPHDGNSVWIYKYDAFYNTMNLIASSNAHNALVYSVAWLCNDCTVDQNSRILAIGGEAADGAEVRLLKFNSYSEEIFSLGSASFGATVFSLDWCQETKKCNYLAVGGKTAVDCDKQVNIRIFNVSCDGDIILENSTFFDGQIVRAIKWNCQTGTDCIPPVRLLAVAGDLGSNEANIQLYVYNVRRNILQPIAHQSQQEKVFALAWITGCTGPLLLAGSGCINGLCDPNIHMYALQRKELCDFELASISQKHFDDNITSLATCTINKVTYIVAGSESKFWNNTLELDPLCPQKVTNSELALFKSMLCPEFEKSCLPISICQRAERHYVVE